MHNLRARKQPTCDSDSTPKAKRGSPKVSLVLTRYPPIKDTGDDSITVQRNIQLLIKEVQKDRPRNEVVCSLAWQTFTSRRQKILSAGVEMNVHCLITDYPFLKKTYIVC